MTETALTPIQSAQLPSTPDGWSENYLNPTRFEQISKLATVFAQSDLVPPHFKNKRENCFIALQMAFRSQIDPMVALQNLFLVQGRPGMSAQLAIALANRSGLLRGPIRWSETGSGDQLVVTAYADTREGYKIETSCSMQMARAEGWVKNPKYQSMPAVMLRYRSATFLIRQHMPEVLLGMQTSEELVDVAVAKNATSQPWNVDDVIPATEVKVDAERKPRSKRLAEKIQQSAEAPEPTIINTGNNSAETVHTSTHSGASAELNQDQACLAAHLIAASALDNPEITEPWRYVLTEITRHKMLPGDDAYIKAALLQNNDKALEYLNKRISERQPLF